MRHPHRGEFVLALVVAVVASFFGMFLPMASHGALHNPFWEFTFGVGFGIADSFSGVLDLRSSLLLGCVVWPLLMFGTVWMGARRVLRSGGRGPAIFGGLFVLSLLVCIGQSAHNSLAVQVPLWWNEYASRW